MSPRVQRAIPPYIQIAEHFRRATKTVPYLMAPSCPLSRTSLLNGASRQQRQRKPSHNCVRRATRSRAVRERWYALTHKITTGGRGFRCSCNRQQFRPGERTEVLSAELVPATAAVAEALGLDGRDPVVKRRRLYR